LATTILRSLCNYPALKISDFRRQIHSEVTEEVSGS
jgi:hypothetical protein